MLRPFTLNPFTGVLELDGALGGASGRSSRRNGAVQAAPRRLAQLSIGPGGPRSRVRPPVNGYFALSVREEQLRELVARQTGQRKDVILHGVEDADQMSFVCIAPLAIDDGQ